MDYFSSFIVCVVTITFHGRSDSIYHKALNKRKRNALQTTTQAQHSGISTDKIYLIMFNIHFFCISSITVNLGVAFAFSELNSLSSSDRPKLKSAKVIQLFL